MKIHLLLGSTGAGKTTYAIELAKRHKAVRFAVDDYMKTLFFPDMNGELTFEWAMQRVNRCEEMIWHNALQLLDLGIDVILEVSMTTRQLRNKQCDLAQQSGHDYQIHYLDINQETRRQRVLNRNQEKGESYSFEVDEGMFDFVENMFEVPDESELVNAIIIRDA